MLPTNISQSNLEELPLEQHTGRAQRRGVHPDTSRIARCVLRLREGGDAEGGNEQVKEGVWLYGEGCIRK